MSANGEGAAAARIAELEAQVSSLLAAREVDYEHLALLAAQGRRRLRYCEKCEQYCDGSATACPTCQEHTVDEAFDVALLNVLNGVQKDLRRLSAAVFNELDVR